MARSWEDVRSRMNLDEAKVDDYAERMRGEVRAYRLREMRESRGLTHLRSRGS